MANQNNSTSGNGSIVAPQYGSSSTVFGQTMKIIGEVSSDEELRLDGELEGKLTSKKLTIGPDQQGERQYKGPRSGRFSVPCTEMSKPKTASRFEPARFWSAISRPPESSSKMAPTSRAGSISPEPDAVKTRRASDCRRRRTRSAKAFKSPIYGSNFLAKVI